jgi:predicted TIM-barrel fold metal-dependent hydrolase
MTIDFHTHPLMIQEILPLEAGLEKNVRDVFGLYFPAQPLEVFIKEMDAAEVEQCVLLPIDCTSAHGCKLPSNETIAWLVKQNSRLIGFASVDPRSPKAPQDLEYAIRKLGLKGLKLDPALQQFDLNSKEVAYPVYEACSSLNIPVVVHCGLNWSPLAMTADAHPLGLEKPARDFPKLNFIIAHLGWPWVNEAASLAMKYANIHLDTSVVYSGTPSECFNQVIRTTLGKRLFERNLIEKTLFGSNYPRVDIRRTMRGIRSLKFSETCLTRLLDENAKRLLGL